MKSINFDKEPKIMTILVYFISKTLNNTAFNKIYVNIEDFSEIYYICKELGKLFKTTGYTHRLKKIIYNTYIYI